MAAEHGRRWPVLIGAVAYGVVGLLGLFPAALSFMMFDAPGSEDNPVTIVLVGAIVATPCVFIVSALLLGLAYGRRDRRLAAIAFGLPAIPVAAIVIAAIALQWRCGGRFACR